jgi:hypothetical protein
VGGLSLQSDRVNAVGARLKPSRYGVERMWQSEGEL